MTKATFPLKHDLDPVVAQEIALRVPTRAGPPPAEIAARMDKIRADLLAMSGGIKKFKKETGIIIRNAIDYVIDAPTLYRYSITDLEPDEKTAIGKRIERMLRFEFNIPRGKKLDITLAKEDVDIKTTMTNKWMFSKSSWNHINLLITYDEKKALYSVGLVFVMESQMGEKNRDTKRSMKKKYYEDISWIVENEPYPQNFLAAIPAKLLNQITTPGSGNERVETLLTVLQKKPVPRHAICCVANQKDPLKRLRRNGGAREALWAKRILVLAGTSKSDKAIAEAVLSIQLKKEEFVSISADTPALSKAMLKSYMQRHKHRNI